MKNLEKFDLQKALDGAELVTRDGIEVTEWHYFGTLRKDEPFPITAVINGSRRNYTLDGAYSELGLHQLNLFIKPKVKECWVNVYIDINGNLCVGSHYSSEELALKAGLHKIAYIKTIRITDEPE